MKVEWRICEEAEREHRRNRRQYAHVYHVPGQICLCKAFWELPKVYRDGVLLHEIGHLVAGPEGSEEDATRAAETLFGVQIDYADSPYGEELERVGNAVVIEVPTQAGLLEQLRDYPVGTVFHVLSDDSYFRIYELKGERGIRRMSKSGGGLLKGEEKYLENMRRRNQGEVQTGEWIPAHAVRFRDSGEVDVMTEGGPVGNPYGSESISDVTDIKRAGYKRGQDILRTTGVRPSIIEPDSINRDFEIWWEYEGERISELPKSQARRAWIAGFKGRYGNGRSNPSMEEAAYKSGYDQGTIDRLRREDMPPPWPRTMVPDIRSLMLGSEEYRERAALGGSFPMMPPDVVDAWKEGYRRARKGLK